MTLLNKFTKVFVWICIFTALAIIAKGGMEARYGMDKGLNSDSNPILLLPEEAQTSANVYYNNKKVIKRPGSETITTYTAGTDTNDIAGIISAVIGDNGVFNSGYYELVFSTENTADNANVNLRVTDDLGTVHTTAQTISGNMGWTGVYATGSRSGDFNYVADCASVSDQYFCTTTNMSGFTENGSISYATGNFVFDARYTKNLIDSFEYSANLSCYGVSEACSGANVSASSSYVKQGTYAFIFQKGGTDTQAIALSALPAPINVANMAKYSIYIDINGAANLAKISKLEVGFSTAGTATDYKRWALTSLSASGKYYEITQSGSSSTIGSTDLYNVTQVIIYIETNNSTDTLTNIVADSFTFIPQLTSNGNDVPAPASPMTAAVGVAGALTGAYTYYYTCVDWSGNESNVGTAATVTATADKVDLTVPVSATSGCSGNKKSKKIYRNKNGGTVYYFVTTLDIADAAYTDNATDASLDTTLLAPISGNTNDNGANIPAKYVESHKNRIFLAGFFDDTTNATTGINNTFGNINSSRIRYSDYTAIGPEPLSFRTNDYLDISTDDGQIIKGMISIEDALYVFKNSSIYEIVGDAPENFASVQISSEHGAVSNRAIATDGKIIYFLDRNGIFAFDGESFLEISQSIRNIFVDTAMNQKELYAFAEYYPTHKQVWFVLPTAPSVASLGASTAYIYHTETGAWSTFTFKLTGSCTSMELTALRYVQETANIGRMHIGTGNKALVRYYKDTSDAILLADTACSIASTWRSKCFFQTEGGLTPTGEKIYDYAYLIADSESSGDISFDWWYDWDYSTAASETVSLVNASSSLVINKTYTTGGSGNNRCMWFGFSDTSTTDTFTVHGVELHYKPSGGER